MTEKIKCAGIAYNCNNGGNQLCKTFGFFEKRGGNNFKNNRDKKKKACFHNFDFTQIS